MTTAHERQRDTPAATSRGCGRMGAALGAVLVASLTPHLACSGRTARPAGSAAGAEDTWLAPDHQLGAGEVGVDGATCLPVQPPPPLIDATRSRFALSLYHFNIEYVIGGLDYTDGAGHRYVFAGVEAATGWTDEKVEDWIVRETFHPVLEMYERHPAWGVTIELQGRFVEVLASRHPQSLALLRQLAQRGQVELVSFHYNAQLFLAFAREDMDRSIAATRAIFDLHCLPLSDVVFNQEGQAGEGRQRALVEHGYRVGVFPRNLFRYLHEDIQPFWPWYASEGGVLIAGPGGVDPASGVEVAWDVFDDGELFAVPSKLNPYFSPVTQHSPAALAALETKLQAREESGFALSTVASYVAHLEARGVEQRAAPPLLDGTWQAPSTDSIHRWLGGRSDVFADGESDNAVRTANARARREVIAAQVLLEAAQASGKLAATERAAFEAEVRGLWHGLWRAQVSDGSGVNPWIGERLACLEESARVQALALALHPQLLATLGTKHATIDVESRTVVPIAELGGSEPPAPSDPPLDVTVTAGARPTKTQWWRLGEQHWQLNVSFGAADSGAPCQGCDARHVQVDFARTDDVIRYSPGLLDDEVRTYPRDAFSWLNGEVYLPLANGLIGLGPDLWLVKHTTTCHVAVRLADASASASFIDRSLQPGDHGAWAFDVLRGDEKAALALARRLNTHPVLQR